MQDKINSVQSDTFLKEINFCTDNQNLKSIRSNDEYLYYLSL